MTNEEDRLKWTTHISPEKVEGLMHNAMATIDKTGRIGACHFIAYMNSIGIRFIECIKTEEFLEEMRVI